MFSFMRENGSVVRWDVVAPVVGRGHRVQNCHTCRLKKKVLSTHMVTAFQLIICWFAAGYFITVVINWNRQLCTWYSNSYIPTLLVASIGAIVFTNRHTKNNLNWSTERNMVTLYPIIFHLKKSRCSSFCEPDETWHTVLTNISLMPAYLEGPCEYLSFVLLLWPLQCNHEGHWTRLWLCRFICLIKRWKCFSG